MVTIGGTTITMSGGKVHIKSGTIVLEGDVHLGGEGGQLVHRKGDADSSGDLAVGSATKVYAFSHEATPPAAKPEELRARAKRLADSVMSSAPYDDDASSTWGIEDAATKAKRYVSAQCRARKAEKARGTVSTLSQGANHGPTPTDAARRPGAKGARRERRARARRGCGWASEAPTKETSVPVMIFRAL